MQPSMKKITDLALSLLTIGLLFGRLRDRRVSPISVQAAFNHNNRSGLQHRKTWWP